MSPHLTGKEDILTADCTFVEDFLQSRSHLNFVAVDIGAVDVSIAVFNGCFHCASNLGRLRLYYMIYVR